MTKNKFLKKVAEEKPEIGTYEIIVDGCDAVKGGRRDVFWGGSDYTRCTFDRGKWKLYCPGERGPDIVILETRSERKAFNKLYEILHRQMEYRRSHLERIVRETTPVMKAEYGDTTFDCFFLFGEGSVVLVSAVPVPEFDETRGIYYKAVSLKSCITVYYEGNIFEYQKQNFISIEEKNGKRLIKPLWTYLDVDTTRYWQRKWVPLEKGKMVWKRVPL